MYKLLAISAAAAAAFTALAMAGGAQAQAYAYGRPAYDDGGYRHGGGGFTLLGARAGVTVLGVDLDGSAGLRIGLYDHRGGGREAYAPQPVEYGPPEAYGPPESYGPTPPYASGYAGYGDMGYAPPPPPPSYSSYGTGGYGYGYAYGGQPSYGYRPCGC